ncbi:glycosyltransferase family 4 protein [Rhodopirellula sp. MGV]|uniref:glycosyltransferase family 4 protein n=1 Tax=Rhodopirellula sp. MGV TaxID=2023130 RepID=UPI000B96702A|nr:glycosyltransferase family 4 protein [Rhodopirellula sp. MGV]OYP39163.1 hypothetical protein CGZ80_00505 [Rhodopirellula sp. MGV]PNY35459.1 hypothetical protein C2E31_18330 [Rhodopirellula baltica]
MPRLLIVSRCSNPRGGADQIIADLCRELPDYGWNVKLALTQGLTFNRPELYSEIHPELPIIKIDGTSGIRQTRVDAIANTIDQESPDIVLVMRVFDALPAIVRSKTKPHLALGIRSFEPGYLSDARRYRNAIDCCITSGKLIARTCTDWAGFTPDSVRSIAGGVRAPIRRPIRSQRQEGPIRLLYAGRLENQQKRCGDFIPFIDSLVKREIDFQMEFVGTGPFEEDLRQAFQEQTAKGQIKFHGWVDRDQLYQEFYPNADLFVHFAAWEGVTIAPREAMAHGVVPIISRFDGLEIEQQFCHQTNALTFPIGDTESAANCVAELSADLVRRVRLSENAERSQQGEYSFRGAMKAWDQTLRQCLSRPKQTGHVEMIRDRLPGRLSRLGIPAHIESGLRKLFHKPIRHQSPGSEWPTNSGLVTEVETRELHQLASVLA